ncbi:MAG TPA: LysE family translocator [Ornithinibacter sp.]|nr:LysE family translocator [Ornithinibacter sp.]
MDVQLLPFLAVTSLVMLVPGPSVLYAVTQRLRFGPAAGAFAVLGLESGFAIHVAAACLGVSGLIEASGSLLRVLQVAGAAYLALLGIQLLRRVEHGEGSGTGPDHPRGLGRVYLAGLLVDLLNPKTVLFFVAVLPQFIDARAGSVAAQSLVLGGGAVAVAVVVDGGYAVLAARAVRRGISPSAARWGRRASGTAFLGLAAFALVG